MRSMPGGVGGWPLKRCFGFFERKEFFRLPAMILCFNGFVLLQGCNGNMMVPIANLRKKSLHPVLE